MSAPAMPGDDRCADKDSVADQQENMKNVLQSDQNRPAVDRLPLVTTLLRASRDGNEVLMKSALRDVIVNGTTKEELNLTDKSGRTAISYICSNGMIQFLDIILQLPHIDVNKPDNEGNTPLHFAAEAGRADVINMLITRCRTLAIDKKNNLGFTPLMKAALQGRSKSAKLLLFGGASPYQTDPKRLYKAEQWARFCGQHSCADMIDSVVQSLMLNRAASCKWIHEGVDKKVITRSNTGTLVSTPSNPNSGGIRSKLRKVFPFGLSLKDKSVGNMAKNKRSDSFSYLSAAALCTGSAPALAKEQSAFIKSLMHPHDVPKLEVTYANNNTLIKKLETGNSRYMESETSKSPAQVKIK